MRVVIYDDESLEPITVLNLPLTDRDMLERRVWRVPVPTPMPLPTRGPIDEGMTSPIKALIVDIEFEPFQRNSRRHGMQRSVFAFTRAADLAMLLNPAWLHGQQSAIRYLEDQNDALTRMLIRVW